MNGYLGVDVSKGYADFILLDQNKNQLEKVFQLDDTRSGHDALKTCLERQLKEYGLSMVYCAVESTGGLENNWYSMLIQLSACMPVKAARLNPSGVKSNAAATLNRNITDSLSARYIAEYLIAQSQKVDYHEQNSYYGSFRSFHKHIMLLKKQNTQLINEMKAALYSAFPEMMRYCKQGVPQWVLEILSRYPSAQAVARLKPQQLTRIRHITAEKAESILKKAKESIASRTDKMQEFLIKSLCKQIIDKQHLIEEHKDFLADNCKGEEVALVDSLPGIAAYSAAAIMIEIEDVSRFASTKKITSYFGIHPVLKESGDKKFAFRMSKKGRSSMRATLYMCAQTAVLHDAHLKAIYHRHRSRGMKHKQAIGVIMHKLLRMIWGVLTFQKPYQAAVDENNQKKATTPAKKDSRVEEIKAKRRYQPLDREAPVSNRQAKKRKAHVKSQVEQVEQVRDQQHAPVVNI